MACLKPIPAENDVDNSSRSEYFRDNAFPSSDIDIFIYGLDEEKAKEKIVEIYNYVHEINPHYTVCFRTCRYVSLVSQYPYRHIQIILKLYSSPCEILSGFDVDSCAVGYDGKQVWMANRCHMAFVEQINRINLLRRRSTYEYRLAKYAKRGFEVAMPGLVRDRVDPLLMDRVWHKVKGLGKLLVLEKLNTPEARYRHKEQQRIKQIKRGRFSLDDFQRQFTDKCSGPRIEGFEGARSGYDCSVVLPWGPQYDVNKCVSLMNSKHAQLNKGREQNLYLCVWGTAEEILQDCFPEYPPIPPHPQPQPQPQPIPEDQEQLKSFVRGPLNFLGPGCQFMGSFQTTTETDWVAGLYIQQDTEQIFLAAIQNDAQILKKMLEDGVDPNLTDSEGRSALHMAAFANSIEAARVLIDAESVKISSKMKDGKNALHVCCTYGHKEIVDMLLEKNKEKIIENEGEDSSTSFLDNSSMDTDDSVDEVNDPTKMEIDVNQSESVGVNIVQDIIDLNSADSHNGMTPLQYAIFFGHPKIVEKLLQAGSYAKKSWIVKKQQFEYEISPEMIVKHVFKWLPEAAKKISQLMSDYGVDVSEHGSSSE